MSRTNCPQCGAPYLEFSSKCQYCGTLKDYGDTKKSDVILYADDEPIGNLTTFMDYDSVINKCLMDGLITVNEASNIVHKYYSGYRS